MEPFPTATPPPPVSSQAVATAALSLKRRQHDLKLKSTDISNSLDEQDARISLEVMKAIAAARANGSNLDEGELVKHLSTSLEDLMKQEAKSRGRTTGVHGEENHHMNTNPASIRAEEPKWRGFMYPGLSVGLLNMIAAIFLILYMFPHVLRLRRWQKERQQRREALKKAEKLVISSPIIKTSASLPQFKQSLSGRDNRISRMVQNAKLYFPTGGSEMAYFLKNAEALSGEAYEELENESILPLPKDQHYSHGGAELAERGGMDHLGLSESHRNEHLFAYYTSGADFFLTLLVLINVFYSFLEDKTWKPESMCSALGFGIYGSLNMDCFIVAYEAVLAYLAIAKPTKNQHKGRYHWKVWWVIILIPWIMSFAWLGIGAFGPDLFWCFIDNQAVGGKVALISMCVIHYTVLVIVVMAYLPMITVKIRHTTKAAEVQSRAIRITACHLLVHILHYTPGTVHAFAGFLGYEKFWIYVMTIISLQMGAIVHFMVVAISWIV